MLPCDPFSCSPEPHLNISWKPSGSTSFNSIQDFQNFWMVASSGMWPRNLHAPSRSTGLHFEAVRNIFGPWWCHNAFSPEIEPLILHSSCSMQHISATPLYWQIAWSSISFFSSWLGLCLFLHRGPTNHCSQLLNQICKRTDSSIGTQPLFLQDQLSVVGPVVETCHWEAETGSLSCTRKRSWWSTAGWCWPNGYNVSQWCWGAVEVQLELKAPVLRAAETGTFQTCHHLFGAVHILATVDHNLEIIGQYGYWVVNWVSYGMENGDKTGECQERGTMKECNHTDTVYPIDWCVTQMDWYCWWQFEKYYLICSNCCKGIVSSHIDNLVVP